MSEEATTPELVELVRRSYASATRRDWDAVMSLFASDAVWDLSPMGLGTYEGQAASRRFFEEWSDTFEDFEMEPEEVLDLGNGVTLAVIMQNGRPVGSDRRVRWRYAQVNVWVAGVAARLTSYTDIGEARAAAERLAAERSDV
jgi:ketosteroid isomerase-like protein